MLRCPANNHSRAGKRWRMRCSLRSTRRSQRRASSPLSRGATSRLATCFCDSIYALRRSPVILVRYIRGSGSEQAAVRGPHRNVCCVIGAFCLEIDYDENVASSAGARGCHHRLISTWAPRCHHALPSGEAGPGAQQAGRGRVALARDSQRRVPYLRVQQHLAHSPSSST
jgi:hypothetical protein